MNTTLSIIKPDAVKRNLIGEINSMIEKNKMKIVAQKMILLSINDAQRFYGVHKAVEIIKGCEARYLVEIDPKLIN